ncbi:SAM-dependent methyltransferase [Actinomadura gamaensis]|uniref:SAM-dependent methyltransferase n=1 Tax=Actinomadura gamaensis TaxID=1763541 RepID=A0ABV9TUD8_9ACTN
MDGTTAGSGAEIDTSTPSVARMYDYFLGGKDNFAVDRAAADRIKAVVPDTYELVWENRRFLGRAIDHLTGLGVRQFVDIGAGLPTRGNVHEIAQRTIPDARVVYVDNDPIVLAHGRALLADNRTTTVIRADLRDPGSILGHPELCDLIDFAEPVGLLLVAMVQFVPDGDDPEGLVAAYRDALAPGSHLVLTHLTDTGTDPAGRAAAEAVYAGASSPLTFRSAARIEGFFGDFELVEPGVVHACEWRPDEAASEFRTDWLLAGVARKP